MDFENYLDDNEIIGEKSQEIKNDNNNQNNINNEINKNNNNNNSSNSQIEKEEDEEKILLEEINKLENEKQEFIKQRKEQNDILEKYMNTLKSLQTRNNIEFKNTEILDANFDINELININTKLKEIESEERILEEEKIYFEKYKNDFNRAYEDKQKEIEDMRLNYEKEKEEIDKKLEILEKEEKMINDKENNFELEKKILTERYNKAINKEAEIIKTKMRMENSFADLDRRNSIFEKNLELINQTKNEFRTKK